MKQPSNHRRKNQFGIIDIGKIELRFDARHRPDNGVPHLLALTPEGAAGQAQRLSPLRRGFSLNKVAKPLDLGQVQLTAVEGSTSEFPRLRGAKTGKRIKRRQHPLYDRWRAGDLELHHILASETARALKPDDDRPIQFLACSRIDQCPDRGDSLRQRSARRNRADRLIATRSADANDGNRRSPPTRCQGVNRFDRNGLSPLA